MDDKLQDQLLKMIEVEVVRQAMKELDTQSLHAKVLALFGTMNELTVRAVIKRIQISLTD